MIPDAPRARGGDPDSNGELRVLFERPELCMAECRGMILLVLLTAMRTEWLAPMIAAHVETARRYGGPRPYIALCKLDKRYPLDVGFDQNIGDLRNALDVARPHFRAFAVIVSFGGILGTTMRQALRILGFFAGGNPPMRACSTAAEAIAWIQPYAAASLADPFDAAHCLESLRALEARLGCAD
jgi:hypothetical protein